MISQNRHLTSLTPQPSPQPQPQSQSSPSSSSTSTNMATTTSTPITPLSLPQQPSQHQPDPLRHVTSHPSLALAPAIKERQMSSSSEKSARGRAQFQVNAAGAVGAGQKVGSRSPSSIPSSPTSVHSSSSAIFERDIEQPLSSPYRDQLQLTSTSPNAPGSGSGALSPPPHSHTHAHPHAHPPNPHRTPRSKITEPIDQAVPSVLDSAVEMLASANGDEETFISVEAPVPMSVSPPIHAMSRVASVMGSRSPSPTSAQAGRTSKRGSMLLNLPSPPASVVTGTGTAGTGTPSPPILGGRQLRLSSSPKSPPVGLGQVLAGSTGGANTSTSTSTDLSNTTTAAMASLDALQTQTRFPSVPNTLPGAREDAELDSERSPTTTTAEHPGVAFPLVPGSALGPATPTATTTMRQGQGQTPSPTANVRALPSVPNHVPGQGQVSTSHPPSPYSASLNLSQSQSPPVHTNIATPPSPTFHATNSKRLSFVSYSDLLSSAPVSTLPLASLTTSASAEAPPPHLPAVGAALSFPNSPISGSTAGSAAASMLDGVLGSGAGFPNANWKRSSVISGGSGSGAQGINLDDVGGEWEREGLGRGLEERLEALMVASAAAGVNVSAAVVATAGGSGGGSGNGGAGGGEKDRV